MCEVNRKGKRKWRGDREVEGDKDLLEQSAELSDENGGRKAIGSQHTAERKTAKKVLGNHSTINWLSGHSPTPGSAQGVLSLFLFSFSFVCLFGA